LSKKSDPIFGQANNHNLRKANYLWLGASILATIYYGICFYSFVFNHEYLVQDDVRQHVVWLQKYFIDPELFPQDIIANYFYSLATTGFKFFYFVFAKVGIEPMLLAKMLPPILALITTIYLYLFTLEIFTIPLAGFLSSLFFNQLIWLNDDLVSATARAFIYPLFAAFLYYLAKKNIIACLILMLLQGLFYPHIVLIEMTILSLRLLTLKGKFILQFTKAKQPYVWWGCGLLVSAIALYPMTQKTPELATTVTVAQMKQMPEFNLNGRNAFFGGGFYRYWFTDTSGPSLPLFPTIVWSGVVLPWLLTLKSSINKSATNKIVILTQVTLASLVMFFVAHFLLPILHLPSRYTYHTLRFILAISSGIALTILIDFGKKYLTSKSKFNLLEKVAITLVTLFSIAVIIIPAVPQIFIYGFQNWKIGTATEVYQYLAEQPKDIIVASLSDEIDNIPAFSKRSILSGTEFAMAYHPSYFERIKQRTVDLLEAQYTEDFLVLQSFIQQYKVSFLLIENDSFTPEYLLQKPWFVNSSWWNETKAAVNKLKLGKQPILTKLIPICSVVSTQHFDLLDTNCLQKYERSPDSSQKFHN